MSPWITCWDAAAMSNGYKVSKYLLAMFMIIYPRLERNSSQRGTDLLTIL